MSAVTAHRKKLVIPRWVVDHDSFRRWARSDDYPQQGWISYLDGKLWVDVSMEELLFHNQVKGEFAIVLGTLVKLSRSGRYVHDRMLLTHPGAGLSTEPDGLYYSYDSLRAGKLRMVERPKKKGCLELEGSPDMVLEVVSDTSEEKDVELLPELYWRAGVPEYWRVDARGEKPRFELWRHGPRGYVAVKARAGWLKSTVFGRSFKLTSSRDPLEQPVFDLLVQESS